MYKVACVLVCCGVVVGCSFSRDLFDDISGCIGCCFEGEITYRTIPVCPDGIESHSPIKATLWSVYRMQNGSSAYLGYTMRSRISTTSSKLFYHSYRRPPPRSTVRLRFFTCVLVPRLKFFAEARFLRFLRFIFHSRSVIGSTKMPCYKPIQAWRTTENTVRCS